MNTSTLRNVGPCGSSVAKRSAIGKSAQARRQEFHAYTCIGCASVARPLSQRVSAACSASSHAAWVALARMRPASDKSMRWP